MSRIVKIFLVSILLTSILACQKEGYTLTNIPITMSVSEAGKTKALLDESTFETPGNQLRIYDYYNGNAASNIYINDIAECNSSGSWPFKESHKWTTDGVHKFFGWMAKDMNGGSPLTATNLFGSEPTFTFNTNTQTLTIPTTTLAQTGTPQYDFMYSDIHVRNLNSNPYFGPVPLNFSHLFTAFKITAANNSSNTVYLKKVTISNLKNRRGATISYSGEQPTIQYSYPSDTQKSNFVYEVANANGVQLTSEEISVYSDDFMLMWPHAQSDFGNAQIKVEYNYQEPGGPLNTNGETVVDMQNMSDWSAGSKNTVGLMFKDKEINLTCKVEPWNVIEEAIDFTNQISVSMPITWKENSVDHVDYETGEVILFSDSHAVAECNFHIDTPAGATWTASLIPIEGHVDAFVIEDDTKYGAVGKDSKIKIRVSNQAPIAPRHVVILRITVQTADGRTIVGNLMPKETPEAITEFKIIQNLING